MAGKLKTQEVILQSPNGLVEKTVNINDSGKLSTNDDIIVFSAYANSQSVPSAVATKLIMNGEDFDSHSYYDTTNSKFQPLISGYYHINARALGVSSNNQNQILILYKNGSVYRVISAVNNVNGTSYANNIVAGSIILYLNGSTDYIELYIYQQSGVTGNVAGSIDGYLVRRV